MDIEHASFARQRRKHERGWAFPRVFSVGSGTRSGMLTPVPEFRDRKLVDEEHCLRGCENSCHHESDDGLQKFHGERCRVWGVVSGVLQDVCHAKKRRVSLGGTADNKLRELGKSAHERGGLPNGGVCRVENTGISHRGDPATRSPVTNRCGGGGLADRLTRPRPWLASRKHPEPMPPVTIRGASNRS